MQTIATGSEPTGPEVGRDEDDLRVRLAVECRDCDDIPKVQDAGCVRASPDGDYQVMHNGLRIFCDTHYGPYNVDVIRQLTGHHEPQEEAVFHRVLERLPGDAVMLELGSFWAYYSLWFLKRVPRGRAFLVEPVPAALDAGRRNFALNGMTGRFVHAAVGDRVAPVSRVTLWEGMEVDVGCTTVDDLVRRFELPRIDLLHVDIQGHEVSMLRGAAGALGRRAIGWIFISTHGENIHQRCLQLLRRAGYGIAVEHTPGESHSVDGLIVANRDPQTARFRVSRRRTRAGWKARWRAALRVRLMEPLGLKPVTQ